MPGGGEYEPKDSRKVVGTKGDPNKTWREQKDASNSKAEYEPEDSRNVTGQAASDTDRWQNPQKAPPRAAGEPGADVDPDDKTAPK